MIDNYLLTTYYKYLIHLSKIVTTFCKSLTTSDKVQHITSCTDHHSFNNIT